MPIKTLFNIILKVMGIFLIKDVLTYVGTTFAYYNLIPRSNYRIDPNTLTVPTLIGVTYLLFIYLLIFQSNLIIKLLRLNKGFHDEAITMNVHRSTVLSLAVIVIGGYMVIDEVPNLCRQLYSFYVQHGRFGSNIIYIPYMVLSGAKILIGLFLIGLQRPLVNLIEWKQREYTDDIEEYEETE